MTSVLKPVHMGESLEDHVRAYSLPRFFSLPPVAQLVEQLPFKETVLGSSPSGRTAKNKPQLLGVFLTQAGPEVCFSRKKNN